MAIAEINTEQGLLTMTIKDIDAIVQGECETIDASAALARHAILDASARVRVMRHKIFQDQKIEKGEILSVMSTLDTVAVVLHDICTKANNLENAINGHAEAVGCNYVRGCSDELVDQLGISVFSG